MSDAASDPASYASLDSTAGQDGTPPGLVLVPTPIGNLGDMTERSRAALRQADVILCEDTRVTARLLGAFGISGRLQPLHEHNEDARIARVLELLREGRHVALVSDAGMPLLSDPGYRLVRAAIAEGLPVGGLPGANAATLALVLSGLPPHPYLFAGFPPPRAAARRASFATLRAAEQAGLRATLVWHEAPHRLAKTLDDLLAVLGDRPAAVARELTKLYEEVRREPLAALAAHYRAAGPPKGEIVILVAPPASNTGATLDEAALDKSLRAALATMSVKDASAAVAAATGQPRRLVYQRALALAGRGA